MNLGFRNIMALLNVFDLAEGDITDSNYNQVLQHLNETYPEVIQEIDLKTCDLNTFLSEVRFHLLCRTIYPTGLDIQF